VPRQAVVKMAEDVPYEIGALIGLRGAVTIQVGPAAKIQGSAPRPRESSSARGCRRGPPFQGAAIAGAAEMRRGRPPSTPSSRTPSASVPPGREA